MILRFKLYSIACGASATLLLSTSTIHAFTIPAQKQKGASSSRSTTATSLASLNPDWDNEDFLSSLGGDDAQKDAANDKYYKQADNRQAMNEWKMKELEKSGKVPPSQMELLKEMAAKQATTPPPPQIQQPPVTTAAAAVPPQQQFYDANGNPVSIVYDANGNPIPTMQQPTTPAAQAPPQPVVQPPPITGDGDGPIVIEPPLPPKTKGADSPRPVGFNADAYTMSNTADVYLAQLKQDTKVRKIARMSGDFETANTVFGDDSVREIGESFNENPYTKEKNYAEARAEIEGTVRIQVMNDDDASDRLSSGISYKQKLEQMKAKRAGGGAIGQQQQQPKAKVEEAPPKQVEAPKMEQPKVVMPAPTQVIPKTTLPPPTPKVEQPPPPQATAVVPPPAAAAVASTGPTNEEDVRRNVRTLQGLLLKHRGGPGFGAGRLKAPEAKRLEDTLEEVLVSLKAERGGAAAAPAVESTPVASVPSPPVAKAMPPPPAAVPKPAAPVQAAAPPTTTQPAVDPLAGSVACVEAALKMYKGSSPAEREIMMVPLREAFMAAVNGCNKFLAEDELAAHKATMEAGPSAAVASMESVTPAAPANPAYGGRETHMYGNFGSDKEEAPAAPIAAATTQVDNEKKLEEVYSALMEASGMGKLGLKNMSGDQAGALADKLQTMRTVLLDEMNDGE